MAWEVLFDILQGFYLMIILTTRDKNMSSKGGKSASGSRSAAAPNPNTTVGANAAGDRAFTALISAQAGAPTAPHPSGNPQVPFEAPSAHFAGRGSSFPHLTRPFPGAAAGTPGYQQHITDIRQSAALSALPQMHDNHSGSGDQPPPAGSTAYVVHERIRQTVHPTTAALGPVDVDRLMATQPVPDAATGAHQPVSASRVAQRGTGLGALGSADSPEYMRIMTASQSGGPLSPRTQGRQ